MLRYNLGIQLTPLHYVRRNGLLTVTQYHYTVTNIDATQHSNILLGDRSTISKRTSTTLSQHLHMSQRSNVNARNWFSWRLTLTSTYIYYSKYILSVTLYGVWDIDETSYPSGTRCRRVHELLQIYDPYPWPDTCFFRNTHPGTVGTRVHGQHTDLFAGIKGDTHAVEESWAGKHEIYGMPTHVLRR